MGGEPVSVLRPLKTIAAVFDAVRSGEVEMGVVPIHNSTHGHVVTTLDCFAGGLERDASAKSIQATKEHQLSIRHCLLGGLPGSSHAQANGNSLLLSHLRKVYSHEQALGQCVKFLFENCPDAEQVAVTSTSKAAELIRQELAGLTTDPTAAAIASEMAAQHYEVPILRYNVQDEDNNKTRFLVLELGQAEVLTEPPTQNGDGIYDYRSLVVITVPHSKPGALVEALKIVLKHSLNMTGIAQRPPSAQRTDDAIFLEIEGCFTEQVLHELKHVTGAAQWLGTWKIPQDAADAG